MRTFVYFKRIVWICFWRQIDKEIVWFQFNTVSQHSDNGIKC